MGTGYRQRYREDLTDVAWNGERFVAVGHHGAIVHSTDGDHWQPASRPAAPFRAAHPDDDPYQIYYYFSGIVWNGERFVAVGSGGDGNLGTVVHSSDGDRWELAADHDHLADEHFEAVSYFNGTIMYSGDGDRWRRTNEIATVDTLEDITWGDGRFVAVGRNGTIVISPRCRCLQVDCPDRPRTSPAGSAASPKSVSRTTIAPRETFNTCRVRSCPRRCCRRSPNNFGADARHTRGTHAVHIPLHEVGFQTPHTAGGSQEEGVLSLARFPKQGDSWCL